MVKSGLVNDVSVSHYRLSLHLFTAFIIFSSLIWIYLNHKTKVKINFFQINFQFVSLKILVFLIFFQIVINILNRVDDFFQYYHTKTMIFHT